MKSVEFPENLEGMVMFFRTVIERDASEFGKNASIVSFSGNSLSVRRADGSLVTTAVSPYPTMLAEYALSNRWTEATKLCRQVVETVNM